MDLPLRNIRVLDFSHLLPGELCSTILADLGCEVLRVESLQPGLAQTFPPVVKGESLYYWSLHRNKERIALDLKKEEGVEIARKLVASYDVVLENFRPGVMKRLGLSYEQLSKINERLIYCSISGYGQNSAIAQRPGHDLNFIAEAGVLGLGRLPDGYPHIPGILVADYSSASYAALSVVSALFARNQTGKGQHLDIGMFHCTLSTINILATALLYTGEEPCHSRPGYRNELPNYTVYRCKDDRFMAVASLEPQFWLEFCKRLRRPDLIERLPVGTDIELRKELEQIFGEKTRDEWLQVFEGSDCCVSPVNSLEEALSFAPATEKNMVLSMMHPILGDVPQLRSPIPFREANQVSPKAPETHSSTTVEVLNSLGYGAGDIEKLAAAGVIKPTTVTQET